ncbi:polyprenyl synthetase family protein [Ruania suaedae]|uniref:polyprenyl synthetase family protein n=1 Tax=Ruania suaedae TaxID=2897774 RepID=UPI001E3A816D|nr:polyprenyl synthetase family protein [Ruania suaedae]UFU01628.1 polyprenyl synthetase family protein [Ruania suaedae]
MTTEQPNEGSVQGRLESMRTAVSARVLASFDEVMRQHASIGAEIEPFGTVAGSLLPGGKRLRAGFALAGWTAFGGDEGDPAGIAAGAGVELFQMAALVHDDVIDDSLTRRGVAAAHQQLAELHRASGFTGNATRFGASGAILLGDLLLVAAVRELNRAVAGLDTGARARADHLVTDMMAGVTLGQYLDIHAQAAPWTDEPAVMLDRAERVLRAKAARYSVEQPLCLGAAMAGADASGLERCAAIGLPIGEAFQLRDDLLGVFGDEAVTGKPAADDLREGKRTVLVAIALERAPAAHAQRLRSWLGDPALTADQVEQLRELIRATGAVEAVEAMIGRRTEAGLAALEDAAIEPEAAALLHALAAAAVSRSA